MELDSVEVLGGTLDMGGAFSWPSSSAGPVKQPFSLQAKKDFRSTPLEPSPSISPTPFESKQNLESVTMRLAAFFVASALGLFTVAYAAPLVATDTVDELLSLHARNVTARGSPTPESPSPKSPPPSSESEQHLIFSFPSPETVRYKHVDDGQTVPAAQKPKPTTDGNKETVMNRIESFFPKEEYPIQSFPPPLYSQI
ncbi:uncharacterized protein C8R40DRAFT_1178579 [Lentinula edodes]|uniref:uncharacterized protein n=1 Tax=Lentinula edodes TaxID=5353 RepID=UPI001E8DF20F|nr:uncharacterized protein C8R40DRAFT_1178579 [Lentinula edodes]KAH7867792.1 hypothetical protein C8R40DRAFT_1178579 [Lentinula edodes]